MSLYTPISPRLWITLKGSKVRLSTVRTSEYETSKATLYPLSCPSVSTEDVSPTHQITDSVP